jgi:hypothetical protein
MLRDGREVPPASSGGLSRRLSRRKCHEAATEATIGANHHRHGAPTNAPQARLGERRRLVDGRWTAASPNTAMAAALIDAQRSANVKRPPRRKTGPPPEQMLLSDYGIMPDPNKKEN